MFYIFFYISITVGLMGEYGGVLLSWTKFLRLVAVWLILLKHNNNMACFYFDSTAQKERSAARVLGTLPMQCVRTLLNQLSRPLRFKDMKTSSWVGSYNFRRS